MENNNVKLIGVFASVLLLVIVITASFAYFGSFDTNLTNNVAVNVNSVSPGDATFTSNATQLNLQVPAANMSQTASNNTVAAASNTATLTVNLTGAANLLTTCTYDIVYEYDSSSYIYGGTGTNHITKNGDKEITLQVTNVKGTNNFASEKNFDYDSSWNGLKRTLVSGATIESDGTLTTQNISITGKYYNLDISQTSLEGKAFTGKIYVTNHSCSTSNLPGYYTILLNNSNGAKTIDSAINYIKGKGTPDFSKIADTNEGMYAAEDALGTSYYFRGAVNNNWVKFGQENGKDIYWRIIRINGDNSIRMIYTGTTAPTSDSSVVMTGIGTQIGTSAFNEKYDSTVYSGYMYTEGEQHGNGTSSTIKSAIDNWYKTTTLATDTVIKRLISDQIFCNDRSTIDTTWSVNSVSYAAFTRIKSNKYPSFICSNKNDRFTVDNDNGNKSLDYSVGLITADEIAMAGGLYGSSNRSYYLYTQQYYWSGTPYSFNSDGSTEEFVVYASGVIGHGNVNNYNGARPVVSLSSKAKLSGNGTYIDVYTVS